MAQFCAAKSSNTCFIHTRVYAYTALAPGHHKALPSYDTCQLSIPYHKIPLGADTDLCILVFQQAEGKEHGRRKGHSAGE